MKYKVHRLDVTRDDMQEKLEELLNRLAGDVVAVMPDVQPTFQPKGATARVDFLLVVERLA
jgi:hypothetical protein